MVWLAVICLTLFRAARYFKWASIVDVLRELIRFGFIFNALQTDFITSKVVSDVFFSVAKMCALMEWM